MPWSKTETKKGKMLEKAVTSIEEILRTLLLLSIGGLVIMSLYGMVMS